MKKFSIVLAVISIAAILLTACNVVSDLSDLSKAGNDFMTALRDGNHDASYNMLTADLQQEIGGKDGWVQFAAARNFESWKFNSTNFENDQGSIDGTAVFQGDTYNVTLVYQKVDSVWKLAGIQFKLAQ